MNKITTLLFDLDDTLVVEWKSAERSFIETIQRLDGKINHDDFVRTIREKAREQWYSLPTIGYSKRIGISSWEALWGDFTGDDENLVMLRELAPGYRIQAWYHALRHFGIDSLETAEKLAEEFKRIRSSMHIVFPETIETLSGLENRFKLGLITNGAPDLQWKKINGAGLAPFFTAIAISAEVGFAKPDIAIFEDVLKKLDTEPTRTVMIGNNLGTDIEGAKNAGIITIWINREQDQPQDIQPDYEVKSLKEILQITKSL
jgi:putative hydrolase of the HAD superfamily